MNSILITGAASGIGLATARRFHTNGWRVGLLDVNEGALQAVHAQLGEHCWYQRLDVTDMAQCQAAVADFAATCGGRLDLLFNSAGVLRMGHFEDISAEQHRFTLDVNLAGTLQMCLAALPYLKKAPHPKVLNMSSASALYGVPHLASYSASKFAVRGLTEALDLEWRRHGIRVQDLMPPFVNTGMVNDQTFEAPVVRRMGVKLNADDVAKAAFDALQSDQVHVPVGLPFRFTVLLEKLVPQRATRALMAWLSR